MTKCQHCHRPCQVYLCESCVTQLANMIDNLPWLIDALNDRIQRIDRIQIGTIGRNRRPDELNIIDFDAAETARKTEKTIRRLVRTINGYTQPIQLPCTVTHDFIGPLRPAWRRLPYGYQPTTIELIDWLMRRVDVIARHTKAGHVYRELARMVGTDTDQRGGQLVDAINRQDRRYLGPCTAVIGKQRDGTPRQCGADLYAPTEAPTTTCPTCGTTTDTEQQLNDTIKERDLVTEALLLERLAIMGEPVSHRQLYTWIKTGKLTPRGWIHDGRIVPHKIRHKDPRVFSLSQARQLRHKHSRAEVT